MSAMALHPERVRTIRLYGKLGAKYGRIHRLVVSSAAEAVRALCILLPGFKNDLSTSKEKGVTYAVFIGKRNISAEQLKEPTGADDIRIAPVLVGSKRGGILQTIIGVVLIVVGAWTGQTWAVQMGVSLVIGGVVQALTPTPRGNSAKDRPDNGASYNFNGPVNTSAQGNPVPVGYGRVLVGSAVISAGIYAEDQQ